MKDSGDLTEYRINELEKQVKELDIYVDRLTDIVHKLATDTKVETSKINTKIAIFVLMITTVATVFLEVGVGKIFNS